LESFHILKVNPYHPLNNRRILDTENDKWKALYCAKLKACYKTADFSDNKKDMEYKEQKKETLIEIIDVLDECVSV
jgi:hypothetical protein